MAEGTFEQTTEKQVNTRVLNEQLGEYGLKAARRAPQFSKR